MQKITPFLWFDNNAEEAMNYYTSIFKDAKKGFFNGMTGTFTLFGQEFMVLNGGPYPAAKFNDSISFFVKCEDQAEVDYYWNALTANGGEESKCGWLKDKFGLSWQIIPNDLMKFMGDKDRVKANKAMQAMLTMKKIVVADLEKAFNS